MAIAVAVPLGIGSSHREAPLTVDRPHRRRHGRLRVHGEERPSDCAQRRRSADRRGQLDPVRGPGRRPELLPVRRSRPLLHQRRQHGDGRADVRYRFKFKTQVREPELVPVRGTAGDSIDDPTAVRQADVRRRPVSARSKGATRARRRRASTARASARAQAVAASTARQRRSNALRAYTIAATTTRWRRTTSARRRCPNYDALADAGDQGPARRRAGCSSASATIRSSSTWARRSTASTSRGTLPGNMGGGKDDLAGYVGPLGRASGARAARHEERREGRPAKDDDDDDDRDAETRGQAERQQRRRRLGLDGAPQAPGDRQRRRGRQGRLRAGVAPRQPARQRGRDPARPEGQVQPHEARPTTPRTSASSWSSRSWRSS